MSGTDATVVTPVPLQGPAPSFEASGSDDGSVSRGPHTAASSPQGDQAASQIAPGPEASGTPSASGSAQMSAGNGTPASAPDSSPAAAAAVAASAAPAITSLAEPTKGPGDPEAFVDGGDANHFAGREPGDGPMVRARMRCQNCGCNDLVRWKRGDKAPQWVCKRPTCKRRAVVAIGPDGNRYSTTAYIAEQPAGRDPYVRFSRPRRSPLAALASGARAPGDGAGRSKRGRYEPGKRSRAVELELEHLRTTGHMAREGKRRRKPAQHYRDTDYSAEEMERRRLVMQVKESLLRSGKSYSVGEAEDEAERIVDAELEAARVAERDGDLFWAQLGQDGRSEEGEGGASDDDEEFGAGAGAAAAAASGSGGGGAGLAMRPRGGGGRGPRSIPGIVAGNSARERRARWREVARRTHRRHRPQQDYTRADNSQVSWEVRHTRVGEEFQATIPPLTRVPPEERSVPWRHDPSSHRWLGKMKKAEEMPENLQRMEMVDDLCIAIWRPCAEWARAAEHVMHCTRPGVLVPWRPLPQPDFEGPNMGATRGGKMRIEERHRRVWHSSADRQAAYDAVWASGGNFRNALSFSKRLTAAVWDVSRMYNQTELLEMNSEGRPEFDRVREIRMRYRRALRNVYPRQDVAAVEKEQKEASDEAAARRATMRGLPQTRRQPWLKDGGDVLLKQERDTMAYRVTFPKVSLAWRPLIRQMFTVAMYRFGKRFDRIARLLSKFDYAGIRPADCVAYFYQHFRPTAQYTEWEAAFQGGRDEEEAAAFAWAHESRPRAGEREPPASGQSRGPGNDALCSSCEDGGDLICCDGPCHRSFHPDCVGEDEEQVAQLSEWLCADCRRGRHACFACGAQGADNTEVFLCSRSCGKFYHAECLLRIRGVHWLSEGAKAAATALVRHNMSLTANRGANGGSTPNTPMRPATSARPAGESTAAAAADTGDQAQVAAASSARGQQPAGASPALNAPPAAADAPPRTVEASDGDRGGKEADGAPATDDAKGSAASAGEEELGGDLAVAKAFASFWQLDAVEEAVRMAREPEVHDHGLTPLEKMVEPIVLYCREVERRVQQYPDLPPASGTEEDLEQRVARLMSQWPRPRPSAPNQRDAHDPDKREGTAYCAARQLSLHERVVRGFLRDVDPVLFDCPVHSCALCNGSLSSKPEPQNYVRCFFCPTAFHKECTPPSLVHMVDEYVNCGFHAGRERGGRHSP